jgi:hypothetical protein
MTLTHASEWLTAVEAAQYLRVAPRTLVSRADIHSVVGLALILAYDENVNWRLSISDYRFMWH